MARLYADEKFPRQPELAVPDEEVLTFATSQQRSVLTINRRHFVRLHTTQPGHTGIIACKLDLDFFGQARLIHAALVANPDMVGQLLRVNRHAT